MRIRIYFLKMFVSKRFTILAYIKNLDNPKHKQILPISLLSGTVNVSFSVATGGKKKHDVNTGIYLSLFLPPTLFGI